MTTKIMRQFFSKICVIFGYFLIATACQQEVPHGSVLVRAPNNGAFEIYRIASEKPFQFVSEQIGYFNQSLRLPIGQYLILSDCSHERVLIQPNHQVELIAHEVRFTPPVAPSESDHFAIQCDRFSKTRMRQHIVNRYRLNLLHGNREMLVAMVPKQIDFTLESHTEPQMLSYSLAAVKLQTYEGMSPKTSFFVSPLDGLISLTNNQEFGHWQFLLPGQYLIEVNGTKMNVTLAEDESRTITPSFIKVTVDNSINIQQTSDIMGTPLYVELNEGHWLDLNQIYPVLPGNASIKLNGSNRSYTVELKEGELTEKHARSVVVEFDCAPWDWSCLGSRKVYLHNTDDAYHFAEGVSDVPLLFLEKDAWVSIQGSRDIRYKLNEEQRDFRIKTGQVRFVPNFIYRPNQITDLSRVEAIQLPFAGHTLDLPLEQDTVVPLIAGAYHFAQYVSIYGAEYERRQTKRWFHLKPHEVQEIQFNVLVSEKRFKQLNTAKKRLESRLQKQKRDQISQSFKPIISTDMQ
ncbi:MAG: hypothetical protein ACOH5I_05215 [Oligoflexus sp.]